MAFQDIVQSGSVRARGIYHTAVGSNARRGSAMERGTIFYGSLAFPIQKSCLSRVVDGERWIAGEQWRVYTRITRKANVQA